jgi:hypothetical protein
MWRRVDLVWTDVSEEYIAFIFRVQKYANEEPACAGGQQTEPPVENTQLYKNKSVSGWRLSNTL